MKTNFTQIGAKYTDGRQETFENAFNLLDWVLPQGNFAMMPAQGISETIKQLGLPKVSHIAISNALSPFGLYGIRAHYKNGDADVFVVDHGDGITPVATRFTEKGAK